MPPLQPRELYRVFKGSLWLFVNVKWGGGIYQPKVPTLEFVLVRGSLELTHRSPLAPLST